MAQKIYDPTSNAADREKTGSNPPDPEALVTPELSPSLYAARTAAAIAREAAHREIAAGGRYRPPAVYAGQESR